MTLRPPLQAALAFFTVIICFAGRVEAEEPPPAPAATPSADGPAEPVPPKLPPPSNSAPFEQRLAAARSVKVQETILGLELGTPLEKARERFAKLTDPATPPTQGNTKILWQLAGTDYSAVFAKIDNKRRIKHMVGFLRPGKEIPFEKIGDVKKAPIQSDTVIAWDVVRPKRPLFRVVGEGTGRKAKVITIFTVTRAKGG